MKQGTLFSLIVLIGLTACAQSQKDTETARKRLQEKPEKAEMDTLQKAYFASGCFWCVEGVFESVDGVREVVSGYTGGATENPTYEEVCTGRTGHAESVEVYYDPSKVSYKELLTVFFGSHDPTIRNGQGPDRGTQYRSAIFYRNATEKEQAKQYIDSLLDSKIYPVITTEVSPLTVFYEAEIYHQDFECRNPGNPYVQRVSVPRIEQFKEAYPEYLKKP